MANAAWLAVLKGFKRLSEGKEEEEADFRSSVALLSGQGLTHVLRECFLDAFRTLLQNCIVSDFWRNLQRDDDCLLPAVEDLYVKVKSYSALADSLRLDQESIRLLLKSCLLASLQLDFHQRVIEFYARAFKIYASGEKDGMDSSEEVCTCCVCNRDVESCVCQNVLHTLERVNRHLSELGLLMPLVGDAAMTVAQRYIEEYVQENCKGNFDVLYKPTLQQWLEKKIFSWLDWIFKVEMDNDFQKRLSHYMEEMYAGVRMEQLFNIIIEFPESQAALEDLRECLDRTNLRPKLIGSLKKSLETRLLHPGVNTGDILTAYISAIKALRILDPAGVILQLACEPICRYLRSRDDTVRCIVSSLIDDSCELTSELMKLAPGQSSATDDLEQDVHWETWEPDPIDAEPSKAPQRSSDIISMLVNIYGTRELFVKEYQTLLAERLLLNYCYYTEREIRYLELLKLRFGESLLHLCEVMLGDVADSKRINAHVASFYSASPTPPSDEDFPVSAIVVSAQFWPAFREEKVELPPVVTAALERYTKAFEALKGNRTLCWKPALGMVNLEVTLKDRTLNISANPLQAAILWQFQDKPRWSVEELGQVLRSSSSTVRRRITFWQSHGILQEDGADVFVLQEDRGEGLLPPLPHDEMEEEESMTAMTASSQEQKEEELQMVWSFVTGMLTNLESLPLEQIHTMLHMFAVQGTSISDWTMQQLRQFLGRKVCQDKLLFSNGVYRLPSS